MNRITEITKRDVYELFRDGYIEEDFFVTESFLYNLNIGNSEKEG